MAKKLWSQRALIVALGFLSSCGPVEEKKTSDFPGENLKKLDRRQATQFQNFNGALGDIFNYIATNGLSSPSFSQSFIIADRPEVSRTLYREQLKKSIDLTQCQTQQTGSMEGMYTSSVTGDNCDIVSLFFRTRSHTGNSKKSKVLIDEKKSFRRKTATVNTNLSNLEIRTSVEKSEQIVIGKILVHEQVNTRVYGQSDELGGFSYSLYSRYQNTKPSVTSDSNEYVEYFIREDELVFHKGFKAVLYQKVRKVDLVIEEEVYYLNGAPIGKAYYYQLLQDLDRQAGLD